MGNREKMKLHKMRSIREDDLANIIGIWYTEWKHAIVDLGGAHRLGIAKEDLKKMIDKYLETVYKHGRKEKGQNE